MKSNRGASKRFKVTASGKLMRKHAFHNHILTKKTKTQKKRLVKKVAVTAEDEPRLKRMILK